MSTQASDRLNRIFVRSLAVAALALAATGCGAGSKVVSNVTFSDQVVGGDLYAGIDATLTPGSITLPAAKLPLYNPKNPSQTLGTIETNGQHIIVNVNASAALKLPGLADGTKLPSGSAIPLVLPAGLTPVGIPVFNSNSLVYVAINGNQVLLGVAVTIAQQGGLNLPIDLFLPFSISPQISGTAGFFLGAKQGVAVFAMKDSAKTTTVTITGAGLTGAKTLAGASATRALPEMLGKIDVKSEPITQSTLWQFQRAQKRVGSNPRID